MAVMRRAIGPTPPLRDPPRLSPPGVQLVDVLEHAPAPIRDLPRAIAIDQELIAIADKLVAIDPNNLRNQSMLGNILSRYGSHLSGSWRWPEALAVYQRCLTVTARLRRLSPQNSFYGDLHGTSALFLGRLQFAMHDDEGARASLSLAASLLGKAIAAGRTDNQLNLDLAKDTLAEIERHHAKP